jgi:hypothetical protein
MARELVIWCTPCLFERDTRAEGRAVIVSFDGKQARTVDVCEDCEKQYVTPLRELLAQHGDSKQPVPRQHAAAAPRPPTTASKPSATRYVGRNRVECLICGHSVQYNGESTHYSHNHQTSKGRWLIDHGQGEGILECPIRGCDRARRAHRQDQGLRTSG